MPPLGHILEKGLSLNTAHFIMCSQIISSTLTTFYLKKFWKCFFNRFLDNTTGRVLPKMSSASEDHFKRNQNLLTVTGKLKGSDSCMTMIETPQVKSSCFFMFVISLNYSCMCEFIYYLHRIYSKSLYLNWANCLLAVTL